MASWTEVVRTLEGGPDHYRHEALSKLASYTGRNVIQYYSGWMNDPGLSPHVTMISDADMNGFMACLRGMDKSRGLDLILHTPGGVVSATQAIGTYLRDAFDGNIRAIIPQLAMSAGTMLACACNEIVMGRHSSIGPFDPIYQGCSTFSVLREFEQARDEIMENPSLAELWRPILERYPPGFVVDCRNAIQLAHKLVSEWLETGMFSGNTEWSVLDCFAS